MVNLLTIIYPHSLGVVGWTTAQALYTEIKSAKMLQLTQLFYFDNILPQSLATEEWVLNVQVKCKE